MYYKLWRDSFWAKNSSCIVPKLRFKFGIFMHDTSLLLGTVTNFLSPPLHSSDFGLSPSQKSDIRRKWKQFSYVISLGLLFLSSFSAHCKWKLVLDWFRKAGIRNFLRTSIFNSGDSLCLGQFPTVFNPPIQGKPNDKNYVGRYMVSALCVLIMTEKI